MVKCGRLVVITGPMFSGKTTMLIEELLVSRKRKKRIVTLKAGFDDRYSKSEVVSHDGMKIPAVILPVGDECVPELKKIAKKYDVIGIDEGHFWTNSDGLVEALNDLVFQSKTVYISMLNKDWKGNAFEISKELLPMADEVYTLNAVCAKCRRRNATLTQRTAPIKKNEIIAVGGAESYRPMCRACFRKPKS